MALMSKCGGCGNVEMFELVEKDKVRGSALKIMFVQCSSCGVVVGVLPYWDAGSLVRLLASKMKINLDRR